MSLATGQTIEPNREPTEPAPGPKITELEITGMTCGNCARHVTDAIQKVAGVRSAIVSLDAHQATVHWAPEAEPNVAAAIQSVEAEGFGAKVLASGRQAQPRDRLAGWRLNLWLGLPVTLALMAGEWVFGLGVTPWFRWLSFALASIVQALAGARFYRGAWQQLKAGNSNMDTLVALGSTTAFAYSAWALFSGQGGHLYFMEAAAIITLISTGHWIESRVSVRASSALRQLLDLAPARARRCQPNGPEIEVPVAELRRGDLIALRPGDRVPTDGTIIEGNSAVDEAMLTGESSAVDKGLGAFVYAGTLNLNGRMVARVTAIGEETALAHVIAAVQRAQSSRARIQRLGDRVSSVFVPVVVAVALAAGLWWGLAPTSARLFHDYLAQYVWVAHPPETRLAAAFIIAAGVLIIACPCAMGLATPAAIMAGSNAAARRGILIRDGVALEKAGRVTAVVFDKTGTLTVGRPAVAEVWKSKNGLRNSGTHNESDLSKAEPHEAEGGESFLLQLAASLAQHSTHPVSQAIATLSSNTLVLTAWQEVHGAGVQGQVTDTERNVQLAGITREARCETQNPPQNTQVLASDPGRTDAHESGVMPAIARLGSLRWLKECGVDVAQGKRFIEEWTAQGATLVGVALDQSLLGLVAVKDTLKPGASGVVEQLYRQGLRLYLVTGDNTLTGASIATQVGIPPENVFAEVRPEQKAQFVKKLQEQGERVAFVGDGINDAPALEQADLGIAVSRASDIAREAADIILLNSEIEAVPESLGLARATLRTIKQNLFWAFFYNAVGIPLAALGFMSPILCAAAMGLSDLVVIGNALRLLRWKPGKNPKPNISYPL